MPRMVTLAVAAALTLVVAAPASASTTFSSGTASAGTNPKAIAADFFHNNANLDLATANNGSSDLSLLSGNGAGSFSTGGPFGGFAGETALVTGDFNNDNNSDLLVAGNPGGGLP